MGDEANVPAGGEAAPANAAKPGAGPAPTAEKKDATVAKKKKPSQETVLARARQYARAEKRKIWAALGFEGDFDEAKFSERVEALGKAKLAGPGGDDARAKVAEAELAQLKLKHEEQAKKLAKTLRELERAKAEMESSKVESEIREEARGRGIVDPDYAISLFKNHLKGLPKEAEAPSVASFFDDLRKDAKRKHLFAAVDVPAGPSAGTSQQTQQPEGAPARTQQQPVEKPAPTPAGGTPPPAFDVMKLDKKAFDEHRRAQYGYSPGS